MSAALSVLARLDPAAPGPVVVVDGEPHPAAYAGEEQAVCRCTDGRHALGRGRWSDTPVDLPPGTHLATRALYAVATTEVAA